MRETLTRKRRRLDESQAERKLVKALRGRGGTLTRADATAASGLDVNETDAALKRLLGHYKSHLAVTESGELLYTFDKSMERRDRVPLSERVAAVGDALWSGFTLAFKVVIAVTLVAYVAAFVAMMVAMLFAKSNDRDDRRSDRGGGGFPMLLFWMMPDWAPPEMRQRQRRRGPPGKRFYKSVYDFVFGPDGQPLDERAAERELVAFLRAKDGRITASDLVAVTGWSLTRAEEEATRLLADYDGEPEVAEDGTLVYVFPSLRKTAGELAGARTSAGWRYTWDETRTPSPLTGNTSNTDTLIGFLNAFNLVGGFLIGPAFLARFGLAGSAALVGAVTWFPLAFSSLFFAVPAARWLRGRGRSARLLGQSLRAELVHEIIARRGASFDPAELTTRVAKQLGAPVEATRGELERLLKDLDGDVTTDDAGVMRYQFPRVTEELTASEAARTLAPASERDAGEVVFSSETPGEEDVPRLPAPARNDR